MGFSKIKSFQMHISDIEIYLRVIFIISPSQVEFLHSLI